MEIEKENPTFIEKYFSVTWNEMFATVTIVKYSWLSLTVSAILGFYINSAFGYRYESIITASIFLFLNFILHSILSKVSKHASALSDERNKRGKIRYKNIEEFNLLNSRLNSIYDFIDSLKRDGTIEFLNKRVKSVEEQIKSLNNKESNLK